MSYKLLFVCLGNICRSPAAENIMNYLIEQHQVQGQITCDSAGTGGYHIGSPPDRRMTIAASQKLGITLQGAARQFQRTDFERFDLILAMDQDNYRDILRLDPKGEHTHKVKLMCEFCRHYREQEVPDPYYGGVEGFNHVIDLLMDACQTLLQEIMEAQQPNISNPR